MITSDRVKEIRDQIQRSKDSGLFVNVNVTADEILELLRCLEWADFAYRSDLIIAIEGNSISLKKDRTRKEFPSEPFRSEEAVRRIRDVLNGLSK